MMLTDGVQTAHLPASRAFLRDIPEPTCYSRYSCYAQAMAGQAREGEGEGGDAGAVWGNGSPLLNVLASWLAGRAMFGDVALTLCRASPSQVGLMNPRFD